MLRHRCSYNATYVTQWLRRPSLIPAPPGERFTLPRTPWAPGQRPRGLPPHLLGKGDTSDWIQCPGCFGFYVVLLCCRLRVFYMQSIGAAGIGQFVPIGCRCRYAGHGGQMSEPPMLCVLAGGVWGEFFQPMCDHFYPRLALPGLNGSFRFRNP